jgi:hypothetical protein
VAEGQGWCAHEEVAWVGGPTWQSVCRGRPMWRLVGVVGPLRRECGASGPTWKTAWGGGPTWRRAADRGGADHHADGTGLIMYCVYEYKYTKY